MKIQKQDLAVLPDRTALLFAGGHVTGALSLHLGHKERNAAVCGKPGKILCLCGQVKIFDLLLWINIFISRLPHILLDERQSACI